MNRVLVYHGVPLGKRLGLVRYEDLVADPEGVFREVLDFLDEPWSPAVLEHHRVQSDRAAPALVDGRTRTTDPIDKARDVQVDEGADKPRPPPRPRKDRGLGRVLRLRRRPAETCCPVSARGLVAPVSADGEELAARRTEFEGRLDFRRPVSPGATSSFAFRPSISEAPDVHRSRLAPVVARLPASVRTKARLLRRRLRQRARTKS